MARMQIRKTDFCRLCEICTMPFLHKRKSVVMTMSEYNEDPHFTPCGLGPCAQGQKLAI